MMQRKKRKLSLVLFIALMLLFSVPLTVMATSGDTTTTTPTSSKNFDLANQTESIVINSCTGENCRHEISNSNASLTEWRHSILVTGGAHTIVFKNSNPMNIKAPASDTIDSGHAPQPYPAFQLEADAKVTIVLEAGSNVTLDSTESTGGGLMVPNGTKLQIQGNGTLTARGFKEGAGIGGYGTAAGDIVIKGDPTIKAYGGAGAAGIGSGKLGGHGAITIEGGSITAKGGDGYVGTETDGNQEHSVEGGPGIGYPKSLGDKTNVTRGTVTISGGTINAEGGRKRNEDPNTDETVNGIQCDYLTSGNGSANITTDPSTLVGVKQKSPTFSAIIWQKDGVRGDIWGNAELKKFPTRNPSTASVSLYLKENSKLTIPEPIADSPTSGTYIRGDGNNVIINPNNITKGVDVADGIEQYAAFSKNEVTLIEDEFTYTGEDYTTKAIDERKTQADTGFKIDKEGWHRFIKYKDKESKKTPICDAGSYEVIYRRMKSSYSGEIDFENLDAKVIEEAFDKSKEFKLGPIVVKPAHLKDCTFEPIEDQSYTGEAIKPIISISFGGKPLIEGTDYIIDEDGWENHVEIGTATMRIAPQGNFTCDRDQDFHDKIVYTLNFEIVRANLATATVGELKPEIYNGKKHNEPTLIVKMGNKTLTAGEDYVATPSTENFTDAGTITYTITANDSDEKCHYTGTAPEIKFTIEPKTIKVNSNSTVEAEPKAYDGNPIITFKKPGVDLVGIVEERDKGEVELLSGIIDETGSPNVGEYKKIKFDETTALTGDKAGNYKLADGQTLTLKKAVEITKLTPKHPIQPTGSYTLSEAFENRYVYTISIDKESGVSYEFSMDGGTPVNGIDDPDNPGKVKVEIPFDGIVPEEPHTFSVYSKGDGNVEAIEVGSVTENFEKLPRDPKDVPPDPVPEVTPNADRKSFDITIPKMLDENGKEIPAEYRFDGPDGEEGEWGPSNVKTNCAPLSEYTCYIRYLPTEVYGPSEPGKATVKTEAAPASTDGPKYNYTLTPINPDNPDDSILSAGILENVGGTDAVTAALNAALAVMDGYNWDDIKYYDLTIMVKYYDEAGVQQERPATAADFDANGGVLPVTIKSNNLPSGTNVKKNDFAIAHMFSEDYGTHTAGEVETWENEQSQPLQKTGTGLTFNISGTSPIAIAWKAATNPDEPLDPDDPNNPNNPDDPNNPGGDDNNNQGDGNNNQGDGNNNQGDGNNTGTDPNNARATDGTGNGTDQNGTGTNGDGTNAEGKESQSITDALKSAVAALAPKTGDTNSIIMWVVIAVAACAAVIVAIRSKAKNGKKAKASAANKTSASTVKKSTATTAKKPTSATAKKTTSTTKKSNTGSAKKTTTKK